MTNDLKASFVCLGHGLPSLYDPMILGMRPNPEPDYRIARRDAERAIVIRNAR